MSISIGNDFNSMISGIQNKQAFNKEDKSLTLENSIKNTDFSKASDKEIMDVCKSFEAYMLEQVMKRTMDSVTGLGEKEKKGEYLEMFEDKLYQEYASQIANNGEIGLAQQLYEAMKREYSI